MVTAADPINVAHGANALASSLFSVSDADGDTIARYQFWDSTADAASGHWMVNGVAQATGMAIDVTAAQLGQTTFQSGSGTDDLWVRASDGIEWSAWKEFHVVAPVNNAPVVAAADPIHVPHGANALASLLFSVSDADGDTIARYQFWDFDGRCGERTLDGERRRPGDRHGDRCHGGAAWPDHVPVRLGNRRPVGAGERRHRMERLEGVPRR